MVITSWNQVTNQRYLQPLVGKTILERVELADGRQLGELLRRVRKAQRVSRDELANFTGLHRNGIAKVEGGYVDVKLSTLLKISQLLGVRIIVETEKPL